MVEANHLFCQKSITLQDVHFNQSQSESLASAPLHLPMSLNDFFPPPATHRHTHPAEQETLGWQMSSAVICQLHPRGNIRDRPHKCVSARASVCVCVYVS